MNYNIIQIGKNKFEFYGNKIKINGVLLPKTIVKTNFLGLIFSSLKTITVNDSCILKYGKNKIVINQGKIFVNGIEVSDLISKTDLYEQNDKNNLPNTDNNGSEYIDQFMKNVYDKTENSSKKASGKGIAKVNNTQNSSKVFVIGFGKKVTVVNGKLIEEDDDLEK